MMYYNKRVVNRSGRIITDWQGPDTLEVCPVENYDIYQNYIDELDPSVRFDNYYFVSPSLSTHIYRTQLLDLGDEFNYEDSVLFMLEDLKNDGGVISNLEEGNTCIIIDMGVELVNEETYRLVDKFFGHLKCHHNVKYWTMYENCEWEGTIEIVSASRTALRYGDWDYDRELSIPLTDNEPRHILSLNRRLRTNRILLMAELLKRNLNISKDFYLSFLGSANDNITPQMDKDSITGIASYHSDDYDKEIFERIAEEIYDTRLPYNPEIDRDEWFGSSSLDRVSEMFPIRQKIYVEVITEFTATDNGLVSISEKLSQAILSKKPFIIVGDKGFMAHLRKMEFRTFGQFWSEEYDKGSHIQHRVKLIGDSIEKILTIPLEVDDCGTIIYDEKMQRILEHNYNHYKDNFVHNVDRRILTSLSIDDNLKLKPGLTSKQIKKIDDLDWNNKIWYSENTQVAIIPTESNIVLDEISPKLGFKLISIDDVDFENTSLVAFSHDPRKRLYMGAVALAKELGKETEEILSMVLDGDKEILQDARIKQQELPYDKIDYLFDLDNPYEHGFYKPIDHDSRTRIHRIVREISHIIQRKLVFKSHMSSQIEWESAWADEKVDKLLNSNYVYDMFKDHFELYFKKGTWRNRHPSNIPSLRGRFDKFITEFFEEQDGIIEYFKEKGHSDYFNASLMPEYWANHIMIMKNIGLHYAPRDTKILDMGTHFGITPKFLESEGFTEVNCTNSYEEAGDMLPDLQHMWKEIDLDPMNIHIRPQQKFKLDKKYDVILVTMSNIFWQSDRIVNFTQGSVSQNSANVDSKTGAQSTFFMPYMLKDIKFFIENIKECLEPGGIAVLQPYPFVYNEFDNFYKESKFLLQYQNRDTGYEYPLSTMHSPKAELNDFIVIQNR